MCPRTDCTKKPMLAHGGVLPGGRWWVMKAADRVIRSTPPGVVGVAVTPLSLMIDTNEWRSSRGVQLVPSPAALVMRRNERRTLAASSAVPTLVAKTRSLSCHVLPAAQASGRQSDSLPERPLRPGPRQVPRGHRSHRIHPRHPPELHQPDHPFRGAGAAVSFRAVTAPLRRF
jgi:hypothetical protein